MYNQIFKGVRILDFTQVISGPQSTAILGDMGAEIIKVEPPIIGDTLRGAVPFFNGISGFFELQNRNKKSISLNLKKSEALEIIQKIIPSCQVVVQNFKPGIMAKLGLSYDDIRKIKPDIIYASISGYGQSGRYAERSAYDIIIQAETGLASLNGYPPNPPPLRSPFSIADYLPGAYTAAAISAALYHHKNTGQGQSIDVAMFDSIISAMDSVFMLYQINKDKLVGKDHEEKVEILEKFGMKSTGNSHGGIAPYGYYKTKDGHISHASLSTSKWYDLLKVMDQEQLIGKPEYETTEGRRKHWQEIDTLIENWTKDKTNAEVLEVFEANRLACGTVRTIDEVFEDPHNNERKIFETLNHPIGGKIDITNVPIKFSETPTKIKCRAPYLGEHNTEVLRDIVGYSEEQISKLAADGVLYSKEM